MEKIRTEHSGRKTKVVSVFVVINKHLLCLLLFSGHYLIFQANYKSSANMDCSPSFSHIESPWIEQSLPHCTLQFNFTSENKRVTTLNTHISIILVTVEDFQMTNEHAYMEVSLSDKSGAVIPLELYQHNIIGRDQHKDRRNPWYTVRYEVGKWSKFKIDIAFFRGVNESKKSYFAIDDIQVSTLYGIQHNNFLILPF